MSTENKKSTKSQFIALIIGSIAVMAGLIWSTVSTLGNIHETQEGRVTSSAVPGYAEQKLKESGNEWLIDPKTVASTHVQCIEAKYVEKAGKEVEIYNASLHSQIFGKSAVTECVIKDNASNEEIREQVVQMLGLKGKYHVGAIRDLDRGGFTKDSYVVKSIHIMMPKSS